jgi:hypothetical protein
MTGALVLMAHTAHATVIDANDILNGTTEGATFSSSPGGFELKTQPCSLPSCPGSGDYTGVGVAGGTMGEIDLNESILGSFLAPVTLDFLQLMVLYDGPEFGDTEEVAHVVVQLEDGSQMVGELRTHFDSLSGGMMATWTGAFGSVTNVNPAQEFEAGVWNIANPFGSALITDIQFTAVNNVPPIGGCASGGACDNNSDYAIESIGYTPVPEPGSIALVCGGLLALALRRRRS